MPNTINNVLPRKLIWACRRGMLELDLLLGRFLEEKYLTLSAEDQKVFEELLTVEDQDLFMWLTGKEIPENPSFKTMVNVIRHHAEHRHSD